ncbi:uncharacterized protein LOC101237407 [Hydra vulgaris]|uniref:uncharacterized protein LOC101237407 n=1 Tax=Hydra vulgaris TaxID=6087 RepID=UPI0032EA19C0
MVKSGIEGVIKGRKMTIPTTWQWPPKDDWIKYPIIKVKIQSDDKSLCDGFDFTSDEENKELLNLKKRKLLLAAKCVSPIAQSQYQQPFKTPIALIHSLFTISPTASQSSLSLCSTYQKKTISSIILHPIHQHPLQSKIPRRILRTSLLSQLNSPFKTTVSKRDQQERTKNLNIALNKFPLTEAKFQYKVLHKLEEILQETKKQGNHDKLPDLPYFIYQMSDLEHFQEFDNGLNVNCQYTSLRTQLSKIGGVTCYANVKAILLKLMTNKLMSNFNLDGTGKKMPFRKTNLIKIIVEAMPKYTGNEIEKCIGNVLKRAPDRKGGGGREKESNDNDSIQDIF